MIFYKKNFSRILIVTLLFAISQVVLPGCDNTLEPLDENKGQYSIYGGLNVAKDVNYIRVKNLNVPVGQDSADNFEGIVTLENLNTGATETLENRTVYFDSVATHNFRATMDITTNTKYRVSVEGPNGNTVTKDAQTPAKTQYSISTNLDTTVFVPKIDDFCIADYTVTFSPVLPGEAIVADIGFEYTGDEIWLEDKLIVAPEGATSTRLVISPQDVIDEALDPDGDPFNPPGKDICEKKLTSLVFTVRFQHLGQNFVDRSTSDTLDIPFGTGQLVGIYQDMFSFRIDTTR